jgi:dihydroorotate dehydrogenase (NAD+) catalytic subunit
MLNAVGLQNIGVRAFVAEKLPELRKYRTAVIANVFGHTVAEYVEVIRVLEDAEGLAAYELKLAPNADVKAIAQAAEAAGSDALTVANTYPAMSIDPLSGRSRLGRRTGGLSGPAIKPLTLRLVYEVSQAVRLPVIGLGGIQTAADAVEYMRAGATAIQVGTAHFADPRASESVVGGLRHYCKELSLYTMNGLRTPIE